MRRAVGLLRAADDGAPLSVEPESLADLVRRFERQGPPVRLTVTAAGGDWSPEIRTTVHRIVQEALTNVLRHASGAGSVTVSVEDDGERIRVEVVDDGDPITGAGPTRRQGYGLVGMAERVELSGGSFSAGPVDGGSGWSIRAVLPSSPRVRERP
jgi:signal transduction histidine kinase